MITLSLAKAAELCGVHTSTLRELAAKGKAPAAKIGRAWIFVEEDLLAYIRGNYTKETPPCRSTNRTTARSGGSTSVMVAGGYVGLLEKQIAQRRKSATTKSR